MSDSLRPHGLYSPWNSLGQNTGRDSLEGTVNHRKMLRKTATLLAGFEKEDQEAKNRVGFKSWENQGNKFPPTASRKE